MIQEGFIEIAEEVSQNPRGGTRDRNIHMAE